MATLKLTLTLSSKVEVDSIDPDSITVSELKGIVRKHVIANRPADPSVTITSYVWTLADDESKATLSAGHDYSPEL